MITKEQLEEWRKMTERATGGPWVWNLMCESLETSSGQKIYWNGNNIEARADTLQEEPRYWARMLGSCGEDVEYEAEYNAKFIASSRTAVPLLLDAVEKLTEVLRYCEEQGYALCLVQETLEEVYAPESEEEE